MLEVAALFITVTALLSWANYRFLGLPPAIGVMVIALLMSLGLIGLDHVGVHIAHYAKDWLDRINFSTLLMNGMLSFLLFAGALHLDMDKLHRYRWSITLLATVGVLVSTFAVGSAAWWLFDRLGMSVPYIYCLVFGALISPTDPIAVLSIMRNAGAPEDMEIKIVGESLFNDGVAVVIFTLFLSAAASHHTIQPTQAALLFAREAGGGIGLGLALGYFIYRLMKSVDQYQVEVMLSLALVVGGYALATRMEVSGPIAMVVAGLFIGNRGRSHAMSELTRRHIDSFWELIDEILNAVLFVLIGLELLLIRISWHEIVVALPLILVIIVTRWLTVALPSVTLRRWLHFQPGTARVLTWGGLRGGISVALALGLPASPYRDLLVIITYVIVLFSILVQGLSIGLVVRRAMLGQDAQQS